MVRDKILKHVLSVKYFMTCKVGLVSHFNFSCVQLVTSLEDQILRSERGGGIYLHIVRRKLDEDFSIGSSSKVIS